MFTQIGKYKIEREIGRGGFGQVFRAFDPSVGRAVAIKVLNPGADASLLARFRNEAVAAGNLQHRNIVTVYEFGEHDGLAYLVMEFLQGQDLQQVMQQGGAGALHQKVQMMSQVAAGLHSAHVQGVAHLDVKPANIMLLPDGTVKIMDFGIARLLHAQNARDTRSGSLDGSLLYMSPEQFTGGPIDALCDIWGFGVIYYELLGGCHPFPASEAAAAMYQIRNIEPQPLHEIARDCPKALSEIVRRALAKDRDLRYQSLEDLRIDTEPILLALQKEEAARLAAKAQELARRSEWAPVEPMLKQILELDSTNAVARRLRDAIREHKQRESIKARTQTLLKQGTQQLSTGQFQEAIEAFEAALRLDDSDGSVRSRLAEARSKLEESRRTGELVKTARAAAPSAEAGPVVRQDAEVEAQRRAAVLQRACSEAQRLIDAKEHDEAMQTIGVALRGYPGDPALLALFEAAKAGKSAQAREAAIVEALRRAEGLTRSNRAAEAMEIVKAALGSYPDDTRLKTIRGRLAEYLRKQERSAAIRTAIAEAQALAKSGDLEGAIAQLESASRRFPDSEELRRAREAARIEKSNREEQRAAAAAAERSRQEEEGAAMAAIEKARWLEQDGQRAVAWGLINAALVAQPNSELLRAHEARLRSRMSEQDRKYAAARECADIEELVMNRRYREALARAEYARRADETDESFQQLYGRVQAAIREAGDRYITRIRRALAAGELDEAEELLLDALRVLPRGAPLEEIEREVRRRRAAPR